MRRGDTAKALELHERIDEKLSKGLRISQIGRDLKMAHGSVSHHANRHCKCTAPRYAYVPESWFRCRKCDGGWRANNGCEHSWYLDVRKGQ
ncbi:hypothetical protein LCGC14_2744910 [marine sediment metagenome]|uniref:Uncharacterized protein n=1 Tax=marine sediment metagenome TaxID=412755 RepID=A0A0F9BV17_9ZZZZ